MSGPQIRTSGIGCRTVGGRVGGTLFFAVFLLMGLLFTAFIVGESLRQAAVWLWPEVECTVLESGVEITGDDESPYRATVLFEYEVDGRTYHSQTVSRGLDATSSYDAARGPADRHPPGSRAMARVNPDRPDEAVLERRPPWIALVALLPLIFVAIGAGGIVFTWRSRPGSFDSVLGDSISQRSRGIAQLGHRVELGVGLIFAAVGAALSVFLLVIPAAHLLSALGWDEVPATVVSSSVRSWSTDDGTSYAADVLYTYSVGGRTWRSNRRSFFPMFGSGADSSRAIVERYPEGSTTVCYVDPEDPGRSVLDRGFRLEYLIGLFPLLFLGAGSALTIHALRSRRPSVPRGPSEGAGATPDLTAERNLHPTTSPVVRVVAIVFIAAFWNGIVSVFVWQAVAAFRSGRPDWFLNIFLIPFVLVGLGLIAGIVYTALGAFNPRPRLTISPGSPSLGDRLRVDWRFAGWPERISHLTIAFEGHEKATYRRGTDTHTDRAAFASFDLVDTSFGTEIQRGSTEVVIPEDTMHSFSSANNAVIWSLVVHGDIARWPDVMETFEVEVRPLPHDRLLP